MIRRINESKTSTKHISCKCKLKFGVRNVTQNNSGITINVDVNVKI